MAEFDPFGYVAHAPWRFARTMPHIPHWYTVRGQTPDEQFEAFVRYIRAHGYRALYRGPRNAGRASINTYLRLGAWKYWTMGAPVDETTIINRAVAAPKPPWSWAQVNAPVERLTAEEVAVK